MAKQPYVASAAIIAGLLVGGSAYSARHGIGQPPADAASAARQGIAGQIPAIPHVRLAEWHAPRLPPVTAPPQPTTQPVAVAPVPVAATVSSPPVTRTSPAASENDGGQETGDD